MDWLERAVWEIEMQGSIIYHIFQHACNDWQSALIPQYIVQSKYHIENTRGRWRDLDQDKEYREII